MYSCLRLLLSDAVVEVAASACCLFAGSGVLQSAVGFVVALDGR